MTGIYLRILLIEASVQRVVTSLREMMTLDDENQS
ncbi:hypothetical protein DJ55_4112 [Yersinia pseudotuberculosis]|nr:hypothetical protein DJ55_4112 [Yersinia pseudotuberculosis]